jgi:hypothetical protein
MILLISLRTASVACLLLIVSLAPAFAQRQAVAEHLFPIKENDQCGYIDGSGRIVIRPQFEGADSFREGLARVFLPSDPKNQPYVDANRVFRYKKPPYGDAAFIDTSGRVLFKVVFKGNIESYKRTAVSVRPIVRPFSEGLAMVEVSSYETSNGFAYDKDRYGFIDKNGVLTIEPDFDLAGSFSEGLALVKIESPLSFITWKYGYIDRDGLFAIWPRFSDARSFSEGYAAVKGNESSNDTGAWGYIDKTGQELIPFQFSEAMNFSGGLASVKNDGAFFYINKAGERAFTGDFAYGDQFAEGMAAVNVGGKENEDIAATQVEGGKWGFINVLGRMVIPAKYDWARQFSGGLAAVNIGGDYSSRYSFSGGKWGYINKDGEVVIEPQFDEAADFAHGLAKVEIDGKMAYINAKGVVVWRARS